MFCIPFAISSFTSSSRTNPCVSPGAMVSTYVDMSLGSIVVNAFPRVPSFTVMMYLDAVLRKSTFSSWSVPLVSQSSISEAFSGGCIQRQNNHLQTVLRIRVCYLVISVCQGHSLRKSEEILQTGGNILLCGRCLGF